MESIAPVTRMLVQPGLENYPFLTPRVEITKANLYTVSTVAILCGFSNAAAVEVLWDTSFECSPNRKQT